MAHTNTIEGIIGILIEEICTENNFSISRLNILLRNSKSKNNKNFKE